MGKEKRKKREGKMGKIKSKKDDIRKVEQKGKTDEGG